MILPVEPTGAMELLINYRYWLLIPLSFIEGPVVAFIAGALSRLGYFNPYLAFTIFFLKDIILDGTFYIIGRFGGQTSIIRKILGKIGIKEEDIHEVRILWAKHGFRTMFLSKLSYSLSPGFLMAAGIVGMPARIFFQYAALVSLAQYGVLFTLGFYFGNTFGNVTKVLENIQYVVGAIFLVATIYYIFSRYMSRKLIKEEEEIKKEL